VWEYEAALARLDAEIEVNLSSLDASDVEIEKSLATGSLALTTLQSCTDSESNRQIVAAGIEEIRRNGGITSASQCARRDHVEPALARPAERRGAATVLGDALLLRRLATDRESLGTSTLGDWHGVQPAVARWRSLSLLDHILRRRLGADAAKAGAGCIPVRCMPRRSADQVVFNWERSQGNLPLISRKWRMELIATKKLIGERQ
jgi:hypothetical protein